MMALRRAAPYLLGSVCLFLASLHLAGVLGSSSDTVDTVSLWEQRMKAVRRALPPSVERIGYLEAADVPQAQSDPEKSEFFMTQYSLAPVVVSKGLEYEWILGNFGSALSDPAIRSRLDEELESYTIQDLGFGLHLIHNMGKCKC